MVLVLRRCIRIIYMRTALYLIPSLLWSVLIRVELRNCPLPGTKTFGLLPLSYVVYPINMPVVKINHYKTVSFTHFTYSITSRITRLRSGSLQHNYIYYCIIFL